MEVIYQVHDLKEVISYFEKDFKKRQQDLSMKVVNRYVDIAQGKVVFEIITEPMPDNRPG